MIRTYSLLAAVFVFIASIFIVPILVSMLLEACPYCHVGSDDASLLCWAISFFLWGGSSVFLLWLVAWLDVKLDVEG
jgi:hypothetical protein